MISSPKLGFQKLKNETVVLNTWVGNNFRQANNEKQQRAGELSARKRAAAAHLSPQAEAKRPRNRQSPRLAEQKKNQPSLIDLQTP